MRNNPGLHLSWVLLLLLLAVVGVRSGNITAGLNCSSISDHLDPFTHKFISVCEDTTFCSATINGTCVPKLCRRDEFPFEYANGTVPPPPMCEAGKFCPDEGSGCRPLLAVGSMCQMNRDEQCAPPADWRELASAQNHNGSICLRSTCTYANATLGESCILDGTTYFDVDYDGQQFGIVITRSNCRTPKFYCEPSSNVCQDTKPIGSPCHGDAECDQQYCSNRGVCAEPPEKPSKVAPWQYAITAMSIIVAMIATSIMLTIVHKRHRLRHYQEVREYYLEQTSLRHSIIAIQSAVSSPMDEKPLLSHFGRW